MSYATEALRPGKEPIELVELDLDWITSATSATNSDGTPCYNTPATCDDAGATIGSRTFRYHTAGQHCLRGLASYACVESVSLGAETLEIGQGLGRFGEASVTCTDWDDDDVLEDPHWSSRAYERVAPYWRRKLARNPYVQGREMRIRRGYRGTGQHDAANFKTYTYLIRSITGPSGGRVRISGVSPLQLLNLNDVEVPAATEWRLASDVAIGAGTATLAEGSYQAGDATSGFVRINDEVAGFARSGAELTLTRAQRGTTASAHGADDGVQVCLRYQGQTPDAVLADLLSRAGVAAGYVPSAAWATEVAKWMPGFEIDDVVISEPTQVLDLAREILAVIAGIMWWDAEQAQLQLRIVRPALGQFASTWKDATDILGEVDVSRDLRERVSRADVLLDLRTPVEDAEKSISYRLRLLGRSSGAGQYEHGSERVRPYLSRWLRASQLSSAVRASITYGGMLRDGRVRYRLMVRAASATVGIGEVVRLQSRDITDTTGHASPTLALVVGREEAVPGSKWRYTLEYFPWEGRFIYLNDTTDPTTYAAATAEERDPGWYLSDTDGRLPGGDPAYLLG